MLHARSGPSWWRPGLGGPGSKPSIGESEAMLSAMNHNSRRSTSRRFIAGILGPALLLAGALSMSGCNNAGEGFVSGAGLGALAGMGLGSLSGNMGKGAAAGAIIGGLGGALIGDQNARWGSGGYVGPSYGGGYYSGYSGPSYTTTTYYYGGGYCGPSYSTHYYYGPRRWCD